MVDKEQLWSSVLREVETHVSKANFSTWFRNTSVLKHEEGIIFVGVPNEFVKDWLYNKYHKLILRSLRDLAEGVRGVEYIISKEKAGEYKEKGGSIPQTIGELPLQDLYIDKRDNLNPRYTFDTFVIGPFNELAHAASQAVVKTPGSSYNPLFIYGGTGIGKTHLIQAIGNHIKKENPHVKIHYITSEKFAVDYINSIQNDTTHEFKEKYRKYDVLIMDDVQFISSKEKTQEELFHLFNALYEGNKQIIFSSDVHPTFMSGLEERLKSRFSAGMIVDITHPEYESRVAILRQKGEMLNFHPPQEILEYIASLVEGNVRELEGILNSLICQTQLKGRDLSTTEVKHLIKNNAKPRKMASVEEVVKTVASYYNIEEGVIYEKTRRKEVVKPRQVIMYILREDFNVSYPTIGQKLGGRDHTTVMHSCEKIKTDLKNNTTLFQEVEQIRGIL